MVRYGEVEHSADRSEREQRGEQSAERSFVARHGVAGRCRAALAVLQFVQAS